MLPECIFITQSLINKNIKLGNLPSLNNEKIFLHIILISSLLSVEINGNGTTVANFLEIDIGSAATAMGGAYVSIANDVSSAYWNQQDFLCK